MTEALPYWLDRKKGRPRIAVTGILAIGAIVAAVFAGAVVEGALRFKHSEIEDRGSDLVARVETEIESRMAAVRSLKSYIEAGADLTYEEFAAFSRSQLADQIGTYMYGWAPRVEVADREQHVFMNRFLGMDGYSLREPSREGQSADVANASTIFPAAFVFPPDKTAREAALGMDLVSIPSIAAAIGQAIDYDEAQLSYSVKLPQFDDYNDPIAVIVPIYEQGRPNFLLPQRRQNVRGLAFALIGMERIVAHAIRNSTFDELMSAGAVFLEFSLRQESGGTDMLFVSEGFAESEEKSSAGLFHLLRETEHTLTVGNKPFYVRIVTDLSVFAAPYYRVAAVIAAIIMLLAGVLAAFVYSFFTRESKVRALVEERTAALERSQMRIQDMAEISADWFWETDSENRFVFLSPRFEEVTGLSPKIFLGRTRGEAVNMTYGDIGEDWKRHLELVNAHRPFVDFRYPFKRSSETELYLSTSGKPTFDRDGNFKGYRGSGRDVTVEVEAERRAKESEERLHRYIEELEISHQYLEENTAEISELAERYAAEKERAEASERSKSEFLASMSHEIRTPMTGVMGFADMLLDSDLSNEDREKVYKIQGATQSLLTIINDILDLSKLDAGRLEIENLDFHLRHAIEESMDLVRERARSKGLTLDAEIDDQLPEGINSDPTRLRQILINLIGNAVKFTQSGGVTVLVEEDNGVLERRAVRISIIDTGIGISAANLSKLFNEFSQADASISRHYEGTGLGLAISKRLVQLMGGVIGVDSEEGTGSTFWFAIPLYEARTNVSPEAERRVVTDFKALRSLNILVAEDNALNQRIIEATLGKFGHATTIVENGAEAVEAVDKQDFDLILMDVRMPEMSGPEATMAIRAGNGASKDIPIIALTADAMKSHIVGYYDAGMNACVMKPIDRSVLLATINDVLGEAIHIPVISTAGDAEKTPSASASPEMDNSDISRFLEEANSAAEEIEKTKKAQP